jgi:hypothetical protein
MKFPCVSFLGFSCRREIWSSVDLCVDVVSYGLILHILRPEDGSIIRAETCYLKLQFYQNIIKKCFV